ncbi:histidine triad nucleotide-binding protein [Alkaliphilus peptidifermentans]|uniref:Histidine triad (HIT) family protein n=1 Tax=Alkaliphilus peptidifermentans DSM 18978 TaxID=1120976 RepID=A0A1G5BW57_9FIRM|nr:histidine triad nucleotide-binding protein [Alkaliphilus peptidifermentans]SCX94306.1 histidine triad (HIT) family protein [Alkaliphilus peptidifermentans DSM 18978]
MKDCIFCKIANGEIPTDILYENEHVLAFKDINPQAPLHLLIIPKKHITSAIQLEETDYDEIMPAVFRAINHLAKEFKFYEKGYRIVNNCGQDGGQTVGHLHFHLLGGRQLQWPPG